MPYPISAVHSRHFVAAYADRMRMLFGASLIGYWPLWEASGATANDISPRANNGTYSNVTLAQAGIGDGRTSASFNGTTSYIDLLSAGLIADFSGLEGTYACWAKASGAGVWTDSEYRCFISLYGDANNNISILRHETNNIIYSNAEAGGVTTITHPVDTSGPLGWFHIAVTWSDSGNTHLFYFNGTSYNPTTFGTWVGALAEAHIGWGENLILPKWSGYIAHAILLNRAATAPEIAEAARASV